MDFPEAHLIRVEDIKTGAKNLFPCPFNEALTPGGGVGGIRIACLNLKITRVGV